MKTIEGVLFTTSSLPVAQMHLGGPYPSVVAVSRTVGLDERVPGKKASYLQAKYPGSLAMYDPQLTPPCQKGGVQKLIQLWQGLVHRQTVQVKFF